MYVAASDLASEVRHASALHFVYSANGEGEFLSSAGLLILAQALTLQN